MGGSSTDGKRLLYMLQFNGVSKWHACTYKLMAVIVKSEQKESCQAGPRRHSSMGTTVNNQTGSGSLQPRIGCLVVSVVTDVTML